MLSEHQNGTNPDEITKHVARYSDQTHKIHKLMPALDGQKTNDMVIMSETERIMKNDKNFKEKISTLKEIIIDKFSEY